MRFGHIVVGPAGHGKTTYCKTIIHHAETIGRKVDFVNLDPANDNMAGAENILFDVRDLVNVDEIMEDEELKLGPNGGLVYAMELLLENTDWIKEQLGDYDDDYILFDCPVESLVKSDTIEQLLEVDTESTSMAGIKSLIGLALAGSAGMTLLILACTLHPQNWWPAIVTIFYLAVPFPLLISKQLSNEGAFGGQSNPPKEWAYFITTGIIISALALPIVMAGADTIGKTAAFLSIASSAFFFSTILGFFVVFQSDDSYESGIY